VGSDKLHPSSDDLALLPAHAQRALYAQGVLSPVDILRAQIARFETENPSINAVTFSHFDTAMEAAKTSEARYRSGKARELEGITVAIKDEFARTGWTVTSGSKVLVKETAEENHPVIGKLLDAGAILHLQTTAPEFFLIGETWSDLWGVTRNPWNLACTPGGSSGGSAAALAAGMTTLAIGSDMGGSIRIPCALTGLYGSKPSYGRVPSSDPSSLVTHASIGPLARELRDLALLQNIMMGPAFSAPATLDPKLEIPLEPELKSWKLAFSVDQGWARLDSDVRLTMKEAVELFKEAGAIVEQIDLPLGIKDRQLRDTIEKAIFSTTIGAQLLEYKSEMAQLTTYGRRFVELASRLGPSDAKDAAEETLRLFKIIEEHVFAAGYDALLTPTIATTRIPAAFDATSDMIEIEGLSVDPYCGWFLTSVFSLLNWMPVITVPAGVASNGVPTGLQIVTRPYQDSTCFEIAAAYSKKWKLAAANWPTSSHRQR
jgi:amidase